MRAAPGRRRGGGRRGRDFPRHPQCVCGGTRREQHARAHWPTPRSTWPPGTATPPPPGSSSTGAPPSTPEPRCESCRPRTFGVFSLPVYLQRVSKPLLSSRENGPRSAHPAVTVSSGWRALAGTPLQYAAYNSHAATMELLLLRGPGVPLSEPRGSTGPGPAAERGVGDRAGPGARPYRVLGVRERIATRSAPQRGSRSRCAKVSVTMTGLYRINFFTMAGERKIAPMTTIFGTNTKNVVTNKLIHGQIPNIDNSDAVVAYPPNHSTKTSKSNKMYKCSHFVCFGCFG